MILHEETVKKYGYSPLSLSRQEHKKIILRCDDCGGIYDRRWSDCNRTDRPYGKIACRKCIHKRVGNIPAVILKRKNTVIFKYGVPNVAKINAFIQKGAETRISRYGTTSSNSFFGQSETQVKDYLFSLGYKFNPSWAILGNREIDLYNDELRLGVEYCGLRWHTEIFGRGKYYHQDKYLRCREQGIQLITIFEDEWLFEPDRCKKFLKQAVTKKYYGLKKYLKDLVRDNNEIYINTDNRWNFDHLLRSMKFSPIIVNEPNFMYVEKDHSKIRYINSTPSSTIVWDCGETVWKYEP